MTKWWSPDNQVIILASWGLACVHDPWPWLCATDAKHTENVAGGSSWLIARNKNPFAKAGLKRETGIA